MRAESDTIVTVGPDRYEEGRFSVRISPYAPYNSWHNLPVTFGSEDSAERVAKVIREEMLK